MYGSHCFNYRAYHFVRNLHLAAPCLEALIPVYRLACRSDRCWQTFQWWSLSCDSEKRTWREESLLSRPTFLDIDTIEWGVRCRCSASDDRLIWSCFFFSPALGDHSDGVGSHSIFDLGRVRSASARGSASRDTRLQVLEKCVWKSQTSRLNMSCSRYPK